MKRAKRVECQSESSVHVIPNGARDTDTAGGALGLETGNHVHRVAVQLSSIGDGVTDIDADTEADGLIGRLLTIEHGHKLLHPYDTADSSVDAVEGDQQGVAPCLDDR